MIIVGRAVGCVTVVVMLSHAQYSSLDNGLLTVLAFNEIHFPLFAKIFRILSCPPLLRFEISIQRVFLKNAFRLFKA